MKIRLMGLPEETEAAVQALRENGGLDVLEVSDPRANRGDSSLVRVYVEVRLSTPPTPAPLEPDAGEDDQQQAMRRQLRQVRNVVAWARAQADTMLTKRDRTPTTQPAQRREWEARAHEIRRVANEVDRALGEEQT